MSRRRVKAHERKDGTRVRTHERQTSQSGERRNVDPDTASAAAAAAAVAKESAVMNTGSGDRPWRYSDRYPRYEAVIGGVGYYIEDDPEHRFRHVVYIEDDVIGSFRDFDDAKNAAADHARGAPVLNWEYSLRGDSHTATVDGTKYVISAGVGFDTDWRAYGDGDQIGSFKSLNQAKRAVATYAEAKRRDDPAERETRIGHLRDVIRSYEAQEPLQNEPPRTYEEAKHARAELRDTYGLDS